MGIIVTKFGGSSLADAGQFRKVRDILLANPERRFVVPSAPGQRFKDDVKEVASGYECGMSIENYNDIKENDVIECFVMEEVKP